MPFANFNTVSPRTSLPSRVALALAYATVDSETHPQVVSFIPTGQEITQTVEDYIEKYFCNINGTVNPTWNAMIDHKFPKDLAKGTAALNSFRHYMVQDALYLEIYYRVRMDAVSRTGSLEEIQAIAAKLSNSLQYAANTKTNLTSKLGIPKVEVDTEPQSEELKNSVEFYNKVATTKDWLDMNIAFLPCIMGYYTIASRLLSDPITVRNTVYFSLWVLQMSDGSTTKSHKEFINGRIAALFATITPEQQKAKLADWLKTFDEACTHETKFFGLGNIKKAYGIVSNNEYNIRSYLESNLYLVVDHSTSVIVKAIDPKDSSAKWTLANSPDGSGYTIKNGNKFLGLSTAAPIHRGQQVSLFDTEQHWSINTDGDGQALFQFLAPTGPQWVVDTESPAKVVVENNSHISSQLWLIKPVPA